MRSALILVLVATAALPGALWGAPSPAPGDAAIARATALSQEWGRCPTARPAARLLAQAVRTEKPRPRVLRARAAVRAWTAVAAECSAPVAMPTVTPGT